MYHCTRKGYNVSYLSVTVVVFLPMSNWKTKSDQSFQAANKLIKEALHNTSVHCSYYSCVQYVFHVLVAHFGMEEQQVERESHGSNNKIGTHIWLRQQIYRSLRSRGSADALKFNNDMAALCEKRVMADYLHETIDEVQAEEIRQTAYGTLQILKNNYEA